MTIFEVALGGVILGALGGFTVDALVVGTFKRRPEMDAGPDTPRPNARPIPTKQFKSMKWTEGSPDVGDTRKRSGFLWLPMTIGGETRWLEYARWEECYGRPLPPDHPDAKRRSASLEAPRWYAFQWLPVCACQHPTTPDHFPYGHKPDPPYKMPTVSTSGRPVPPTGRTGEQSQ